MEIRIEETLKALERNNITGHYAETKADVCRIVEKMLFDGCTITSGGSVSVKESGVWDIISESRYRFLDRSRPGITEKEQENVYKEVVGSDFYFCSTNALTENGELVNVDGNSNRISAIAFGPKRVVMIVGKNKLVKDVNEGFLRVKQVAAPKNCVRLGVNTPCAKLGHCVSLKKSDDPSITDGCDNQRRICVNYMVTARQREKGRITVILCGENIGY